MQRCGRPPLTGETRHRYTVVMPPSLRQKVRDCGMNLSQFVIDSLEAEFKRREEENGN